MISSALNISDSHLLLSYLASKNVAEYKRLFQWSPLGAMITDADNRIVYVNSSFERTSGFTLEDVLGFTPTILHSGRHGKEFYQAMWLAIRGRGCWQGEVWNRKKNGEVYPEWLSISRVNDEASANVYHLGLFLDISQRKQKEEMLTYEATHDLLTGLANNQYMRRHLDHAVSQASLRKNSIAVLYIDLDGFKSVNDHCGHQEGDCVLKSFAMKLRHSVRETDFVARVGGDEFVVVLDLAGADEKIVYEVAEKILSTLSKPLDLDSTSMHVSCSIGISVFPGNGNSVNDLLKTADLAMYKAKRQGGSRLFRYGWDTLCVNGLRTVNT